MSKPSANFAELSNLTRLMIGKLPRRLESTCWSLIDPYVLISVTSDDILRRKREINNRTGEISRTVYHRQDEDMSVNSGSDSSENKERRIVKKVKTPKVTLPADDPRQRYAHIFVDAFNSMGKEELTQLLNTYARPDCVCVYKYVGNFNPVGAMYVELPGIENIAAYWHAIFSAVPDSLFEQQGYKIRALPNGCCAIVIKFIFSGTKIIAMASDSHESIVYADKSKERKPATAAGFSNFRQPHPEDDTGMLGNALPNSVSFCLLGTMTFLTTADRKIYKIDFVYCVRGDL